MPPKRTEVKLGLKKLAMLPSYFDYIFVHVKTKSTSQAQIKPEILSTLGPNPARTQTRPKEPGPTYNSEIQQKGVHGNRVLSFSDKSLVVIRKF